jgi:hypothetical protein
MPASGPVNRFGRSVPHMDPARRLDHAAEPDHEGGPAALLTVARTSPG